MRVEWIEVWDLFAFHKYFWRPTNHPFLIASPSMVHDAVWRLARTPGIWEWMSASPNESRAHLHGDTRRLNVFQICFRRSKYSTDGLQASTANLFISPRKGAYLALFRWYWSGWRGASGALVSDGKGRDIKIGVYTLTFHTLRLLIKGAGVSLDYELSCENGFSKYNITSYPPHPIHLINSSQSTFLQCIAKSDIKIQPHVDVYLALNLQRQRCRLHR
ncbi:hypothetical protein M405DRAFT_624628 [Rhizopogon salebrosus TDB-379]|nr:hypothetical protein M405DRAFT_624628 [Rhizopogon salebrosus TDB-379]